MHSNIYVPLLISFLLITYFNVDFKTLLHITNLRLGKVLFGIDNKVNKIMKIGSLSHINIYVSLLL